MVAELSRYSEKNAILTLHRLREVLGMIPTQDAAPDMRAKLAEQLNWRELIHTTYFDLTEFVHLAAYGLHRAGLAEFEDDFWQQFSREKIDEWYGAINSSATIPNNEDKKPSARRSSMKTIARRVTSRETGSPI